ncbi:MAG: 4Fe-4S dicluster domain-containing protein [Prevotellaceae bacterium]|jgi:ferredoxin|nr:4Fe-4S dicluster domain-containing protein [Prevotellaceae bacterium]
MTIEKYLVKKASLSTLFDKIKASGKTIKAPVKKRHTTDFAAVGSLDETTDDYITTAQSAKSAVFPRVEKLFGYVKSKNGVELVDYDLSTIPETVLWGVRPCDAAGFDPLNAIFNWDINDVIFSTRLARTTIVGFACAKADSSCFCTSVGGNPGSTAGSDLLFTKLSNGDYLAEIITEKGKAIQALAPELFEAAPSEEKEQNLATVEQKFTREEIKAKAEQYFESDVWKEQAQRCISCGTCAFVCPTCACFDIQDEGHGKHGQRIRIWDSCGFSLFTQHTSGHNPRETQGRRWRQRVMHKFSYMPDRQSVYGCVGCGRCSRACPADMNLLEHLQQIVKL